VYEVLLIFADRVHPDEFLDLVEELGGVRPFEPRDGLLSRERRHVWVTVPPSTPSFFEVGDLEEYERKMGGPMLTWAQLSISRTKGSDAVAMELIDAAARRWRMVVDNDRGKVSSVEELRGFPLDRLPFNGRSC
jgi:hypothetical protein